MGPFRGKAHKVRDDCLEGQACALAVTRPAAACPGVFAVGIPLGSLLLCPPFSSFLASAIRLQLEAEGRIVRKTNSSVNVCDSLHLIVIGWALQTEGA
jgi:hypothetical protein